jgi:hypothetical protein
LEGDAVDSFRVAVGVVVERMLFKFEVFFQIDFVRFDWSDSPACVELEEIVFGSFDH